MAVTLTVVIPSFNQAAYIEETLRSVIGQRDQIHEIFVYDGGSTDGSADIIRKYDRSLDYSVSQKDRGQSDAIQKGIERATADVVCWLNSDDLLLPGAVRKVKAAFDRNPRFDAVTGYHVRIDGQSLIRSYQRIPGESARSARWGVQHVAQPTCFFKKDIYRRVGGLDLSLHCMMDTDLWCRMFDAGAAWGHIPDYLAAFRLHAQAKGASTSNWVSRYAEEAAAAGRKFPHLFAPSLKHRLGQSGYRVWQLLSGRYALAKFATFRYRGRPVSEVFAPEGLGPP